MRELTYQTLIEFIDIPFTRKKLIHVSGITLTLGLCPDPRHYSMDGIGWAESPQKTDEQPLLTLTPVVTKGLENPLFLTQAGDGSERLFIVEQPGRIRVLESAA